MAFSFTWDATFLSQPSDNENISLGAGRIRDLKAAIKERMAIDHSWAGDANDGIHLKLTMPALGADPVAVAGTGFRYTKVVSGVTEAFYLDSAGHAVQMTSNGVMLVPATFTNTTITTTTLNVTTINATGAVKSSSPTTGIGYATGAGGAVTQTTNIGTAVTINKVSGTITCVNFTFTALSVVGFLVNNSSVAATDTVTLSLQNNTASPLILGPANVVPGGGGFYVTLVYIAASGTFNLTPVINFTINKGVNA